MAKLSSPGRLPSRLGQAAPHDAPSTAPVRTTRSTRSQSREPIEQPHVENMASRPKRGRKPISQDLPAVAEDAAIEAQLQAEAFAGEREPEDGDNVNVTRRQSVASGISGTTAKTSFSQEEIAELDHEVMIDVLPNLMAAADELAKLLVPADPKARPVVWKEIRTPGSRHRKLFDNRLASLMVHKRSFGNQEYIQSSIVLRALLGVPSLKDVPAGLWRPDNIIYKVNLAQMLRSVLVTLRNPVELTQDGFDALATLETFFASAIAGPEFDMEAIHTCLAIQTQLLIFSLMISRGQPGFSPHSVITNIFYEADNDGDLLYKHANALHMHEISAVDQTRCTNIITQLVNDLSTPFGVESHIPVTATLGQLRSKFTWDGFLDQVVDYYNHRKVQLEQRIAGAGGVDQIKRGLEDEAERRADARIADQKRLSFGKTGSTPKKSFGKGQIARLKAREKQLSEGRAAPAATAPVAQMVAPASTEPRLAVAGPDENWVPVDDEDDGLSQPTAQQRARSALDLSKGHGHDMSGFQSQMRQHTRKDKGRSFVDRQPNPQRVQFDDSQVPQSQRLGVNYIVPESSGPAPYHVSPRRSPGKRSHADMDEGILDFDPSQDEGFETNQYDAAAANERRRQAPVSTAPRHRFSSLPASSGAGPSTYPPPPGSLPSPSKTQRKNPGSAMPPAIEAWGPDDGEVPHSSFYARAKIQAKHGRMVASQSRPPQVRTPWSDDEENALLELIEEHGGEGVSYASMKSIDKDMGVEARLTRRTAEDMRFKARNMKQTMLLANVPLPPNWDDVVLDKKAIEKLRERGIDYRQERIRGFADINADAPGA